MASQTKELQRNDYVPIQLVEDILVKLPAEFLAKFRVVCKSWFALITDRRFVNRQLQVTTNDRKNTSSASFLTWTRFYFLKQKLSVLNICDSYEHGISNIPCSIVEPDLPLFLRTMLEDYGNVVVTHCNGIVSIVSPLHESYKKVNFPDIVLCNPILKEFKYIPIQFRFRNCWLVGGGFGYDSTTDDCKLVRIYHSYEKFELEIWIYTLRTDKWKIVRVRAIGIYDFEHRGVYCSNAHYWLPMGTDRSEERLRAFCKTALVAAFDYSSDELHVIEFPKSITKISYRLAKWKESVVLFSVTKDSKAGLEFEMWVMVGRFGGSDGDSSWNRHLTIGPLKDIYSPLEFWKDDELLLISNDRRIVSYNLDTEDCRTVPYDLDAVRFLNGVESYVESLVSLPRELKQSQKLMKME